MALVKASAANLAANPQIAHTIAHPAGCTLTFGSGGADLSHLEILDPAGRSRLHIPPLSGRKDRRLHRSALARGGAKEADFHRAGE